MTCLVVVRAVGVYSQLRECRVQVLLAVALCWQCAESDVNW